MPHLHINFDRSEAEGVKTDWQRTTLLVLAITLHNIPEGLAVGVLFGAVAHGMPEQILRSCCFGNGYWFAKFSKGLQWQCHCVVRVSRFRSFWFGQLSAVVEPLAAVIGAVMVIYALPILPYALAFAAGAMIYVVIEEVVPETQQDQYTDTSTIGFIIGFVVMMVLDVALG